MAKRLDMDVGPSPVLLASYITEETNGSSDLNKEKERELVLSPHHSTPTPSGKRGVGWRDGTDGGGEPRQNEADGGKLVPDSGARSQSKSKKRTKGSLLRWATHDEGSPKIEKRISKHKKKSGFPEAQQVTPLESSTETGDWSPTTTAAIKETTRETQSVVEDLKSGDPKKVHKLNKELTKQIGQLSKSVDALRRERDTLHSDKQKLKNENKTLEKELKKARSSTKMEKGNLRQQPSHQESVEVGEDGVELSRKVEWLKTQLAEREEEIAKLQQKLELQGETRAELVASAELRNFTPENEIPQSKLALQKNGDTLKLALERLLEEQDITTRFRRENLELKVRISSLEVELEQLQKDLVSNPSPKTHKHTHFLRQGRSNSSSALIKYPDESPSDGRGSKRSHSSNFSLGPDSSQEQLQDSASPHPSPKSSPRLVPRRLSAGDTHTLQTCLKLALEEKKSLVDQKHEMEEQLKEAKNRIDQLQRSARKFSQAQQEVDILKQTLKVALSEKASMSEQAENFQREVAAARERIESLEKRLADSLVQKQSTKQTAEQQRELKALREEKETLKKSLVVKNSAVLMAERQNEKLREEVAELRASVSSKIAAKNKVGDLERLNEKLRKENAEVRASVSSKIAAKTAVVEDLERQNEKLRQEVSELQASVSSKIAAKTAVVGELERQNDKLRKENAEVRASVSSKIAAKTAVVGDLERQNEKLRKENAEVRASVSSKSAAKTTVVGDLERQNDRVRKKIAELRASVSSKPTAKNAVVGELEQQNVKSRKEIAEVSASVNSNPAAKTTVVRVLEQQNEKSRIENAELRASVNSKPTAKNTVVGDLERTNEKSNAEVKASVSSKPAARTTVVRDLEQQDEKLRKETVVQRASASSKPADKVPDVSLLQKGTSAEKPKESGLMSPPGMKKVAATRAMFEGKIEDSKQQISSPKHNRRSLILERERSVTWSGGEPRHLLKEERPVNIPPQTREAVSTTSPPLTSKPSVPTINTPDPPNSTSGTNSSASAKPGVQTGSKMSISVKSSVSPRASPVLNTRKEIKEVLVRSPRIEQKELPGSSSIPATQHQNQTQHHLPVRKTTSLTTSANAFQTTNLSLLTGKQEIQAKGAVTISSPVGHVKSGSFSGTHQDQDLKRPRSSSYSQQVTVVTNTPSPVSSPTPQVRTEKVSFKHMAGRLNVPNSFEVRRASSLQDIPEKVSSSSTTTGGGEGTTSALTRSPVPLRQHRRTERPMSLCRADTVNLTNVISRMQQKEKDQMNGENGGGRPSRPTSFYSGDTTRMADLSLMTAIPPAMSKKPKPCERKLQRAATYAGGLDRRSKKALLLRWCQIVTDDYCNVNIENFGESFADGMAFCAMLHHFIPDKIPFSTLTPNNREIVPYSKLKCSYSGLEQERNFKIAFEAAENAGIPSLLDVEDMVALPIPDWMSVMTYVSFIYNRFCKSD